MLRDNLLAGDRMDSLKRWMRMKRVNADAKHSARTPTIFADIISHVP
jgi:hypothetical protein